MTSLPRPGRFPFDPRSNAVTRSLATNPTTFIFSELLSAVTVVEGINTVQHPTAGQGRCEAYVERVRDVD